MSVATKQTQDVEQAINKLKSLHDGDVGVGETVACGKAAIPLLRSLLFAREPSGLFDARCRAVEALAALGGYEVLIGYLGAGHAASDPVERLGDDAVINAAARSLTGLREQRVFLLLSRLAERPSLTGVIRALGSFGRPEAIPLLINALEDDASRPVAEAALRKMGASVREALIASAQLRLPSPERESESSARRRRSSLGLLDAIGIPKKSGRGCGI